MTRRRNFILRWRLFLRGFGAREQFLLVAIQLGLLGASAAMTVALNQIWALDAFGDVVVTYLWFAAGSLLILRAVRWLVPLEAGVYNDRDHADVIKAWRIYNYIAMNNLFAQSQNGLLPPPLRKFFLRLMGARVGSGIISIAGPVMDPYLIEIGENTMIGQDAVLAASDFSSAGLVLGRIRIEPGAVVGARSVIMPGVTVGAGAMIKAMSLVPQGTVIGPREVWAGVPARKTGELEPIDDETARFSSWRELVFSTAALSGILVGAVAATAALALRYELGLFGVFITFYAIQVAFALLFLVVLRRIYPFSAGVYAAREHPWLIFRWNLFAFIGITSLFLHYQRDVLPPALRRTLSRLLGAKFETAGTHLSTLAVIFDPFFVVVGKGADLGYDALLLPHAMAVDALHLQPVRVEDDACLGARAMVMPGATIGRGAVIEAMSLVTAGTSVPGHERWGGVPARKLATLSPAENKVLRTRPIDVAVTLASEAIIIAIAWWLTVVVVRSLTHDAFVSVVGFYFLFVASTLAFMKCLRTCCPLVSGVYRQDVDAYVFLIWKLNAFLTINNLFLHYMSGLVPPALRRYFLWLLGARIAFKGIKSLASAVVIEPAFTTFGENSVVATDAAIFAAVIRGDTLTIKGVALGAGSFVGNRAMVMPGVTIGAGARVESMSLVEEDTQIPSGEIWGGIPARKLGQVGEVR